VVPVLAQPLRDTQADAGGAAGDDRGPHENASVTRTPGCGPGAVVSTTKVSLPNKRILLSSAETGEG
jgi:hypothetical protein